MAPTVTKALGSLKLSEMAIAALIDRGHEFERPGRLTTGLNGLTKTRLDEAKPRQQGQNHKAVAASESTLNMVYKKHLKYLSSHVSIFSCKSD